MKQEYWKAIAIIFIILFIAETIYLVYAYNLGVEIEENEIECSSICNNRKADSYYYDIYSKVCQCFVDHAVDYQKVLV